MSTMSKTLEKRREFCNSRLKQLRENIKNTSELAKGELSLCIYVTGSYGRREASKNSDLDLFFIHDGSKTSNPLATIRKTLIDADLIRKCREMDFPEFSGDGEYLEVHHLTNILTDLGSPKDDYMNYFTARMLLLLESLPIFNEEIYMKCIESIVSSYYRDYHDHEKDFRPLFLVNDIIRFWKTLCLNYEHRRNLPTDDPTRKNAAHLKNLKLKFSRLLTCFSMVFILSKNRGIITPKELIKFVQLSPLDRLMEFQDDSSVIAPILTEYSWFLDLTGKTKQEQIDWIADRGNRNMAFNRARTFGSRMYDLLNQITINTTTMRYLVI